MSKGLLDTLTIRQFIVIASNWDHILEGASRKTEEAINERIGELHEELCETHGEKAMEGCVLEVIKTETSISSKETGGYIMTCTAVVELRPRSK